MPLLFSYGTLQHASTQLSLFKRILTGSADKLIGYKRETIVITDQEFLANGEDRLQSTANFTGNKADTISGTVLELSEDELTIADKYEPKGFKRILVRLHSGKEGWLFVSGQTES